MSGVSSLARMRSRLLHRSARRGEGRADGTPVQSPDRTEAIRAVVRPQRTRPRGHGATGPRGHGATGPRGHGATGPRGQSRLLPQLSSTRRTPSLVSLGGSTTGLLALRLPSLLAGPGSSGSTDPSRLCQGRLAPSPALPGSGCPQLHRPAATGRKWVLSSHWVHGASWRTRALWQQVGAPEAPASDYRTGLRRPIISDFARATPPQFSSVVSAPASGRRD
jgi:hypothetical protein